MKKLVGVDIGSTLVRVVEVAGVDSEGMAVISKVGMAPMAADAMNSGRIKTPEYVARSLTQALRQARVPRQGFILGLNTPEVALETKQFPRTLKKDERISSVYATGRSISPNFELEDSALATYLAGFAPKQDGVEMSTVGVAAVLRDDLDKLIKVCEIARCAPRAIDLSGAALVRSLTRVNELSTEVGTCVDIGSNRITVATRQGMYLRSLRTTTNAGDEITRAIATAARVEFDQAEEMKYTMSLPDSSHRANATSSAYELDEDTYNPQGRLSPELEALSSSADMLVEAVAQSIENDTAIFGIGTQRVTLCGGTALLKGLRGRLQARLNLPVSIGRPWAELERSKRNLAYFSGGKADPKLVLTLATAVGLALWKEPK